MYIWYQNWCLKTNFSQIGISWKLGNKTVTFYAANSLISFTNKLRNFLEGQIFWKIDMGHKTANQKWPILVFFIRTSEPFLILWGTNTPLDIWLHMTSNLFSYFWKKKKVKNTEKKFGIIFFLHIWKKKVILFQ